MRKELRILVAIAALLIPSMASTATPKYARPEAGNATEAAAAVSAATPVQAAGTRQYFAEAQLATGEPLFATIVAEPADEGRAKAALSGAISRAQQFYSEFFSAGGVASQLETLGKGNRLELSPAGYDFMDRAVKLSRQSDGFFDIAGPSPRHLFMRSDSRRIALDPAARTVSFKSADIRLDLARIAPAYVCDTMMESLVAEGFGNASVTAGPVTRNSGRDIYTPWDVMVGFGEKTQTGTHRAYRYGLSNVGAATVTADGLGKGLIDPINKKAVAWGDELRSVTVIASNAMTAAAFAIAAYTVGPKYAMKYVTGHPSVTGIVVDGEGNLYASKTLGKESVPYEKSMAEQSAVDGGPNDARQKQREEQTE